MSNTYNEEVMERLYDEAYEELVKQQPILWPADLDNDTLHEQAVALDKKRWEFDYD